MPGKIILSNPEKIDIRVYKGDSGRFRITVSDPVDVSEALWDAEIKDALEDDANIITSFDIVPVDDDVSSVDVILSAIKSALLPESAYYDIEMRLNGEVITLIYGSISAKQDVSQP